MEDRVFNFLKQKCNWDRPVLIGLSGGPDSLALLHILLKFKPALNLGVAHVDHRWRPTSTDEAAQLAGLAQTHQLPFHLKTLDPAALKKNLEAACRLERLEFFRSLCAEYGYQAVMLAHHADDQAETVLKRIFEGSSLAHLGAMQEETEIQGMAIWRPLLDFPKSQILQWLQTRGLSAFEDCTNYDPRFLRGKFRTSIMPGLSQEFGKEIRPSLCRIANESKELELFLEAHFKPVTDAISEGPFGFMLDFSENCPASPLALKYLVRKFSAKGGLFLTHELIDKAVGLLAANAANKTVCQGQTSFIIDRQRLFLVTKPMPETHKEIPLREGTFLFGGWRVQVEVVDEAPCSSDWRSVWEGRAEAVIPAGDYQMVSTRSIPCKISLAKWWTNAKIPAFFRHFAPIVAKGGEWSHEFLSGRVKSPRTKGAWRLKLEFLQESYC